MLGSNDLPDAFYRIAFGTDELMKYGKQGLFVPLEDLIEQHAPNLNKLLKDNPDIRGAITMSDGHIYALPTSISRKRSIPFACISIRVG